MRSRFVVLKHGDKEAWVYPELGMQLYKFDQKVDGRDVSVIHAPSLDREPADRRYGNPVLFPAPSLSHSESGPDTWIWQKKVLAMPSHGIARNFCWCVTGLSPHRVEAELVPNSSAKTSFPFDFRLHGSYVLDDRGLVLDVVVENSGKEAFPYALGFHPYIRAPLASSGSKHECSIRLPAGVQMTTADQWNTLNGSPVGEKRIRADEELVGSLLIAESSARFLEMEDHANRLVARVSVEASEKDFPYWVIWSASPKAPFVCLEPWTDGPNALNRRETRRCGPGETHRYQMSISVRKLN